MKEAKILGDLLPSHPDLLPIVESIREKYKLKPVYPDDEPIEEIYFGEEILSLEEFHQDITNQVLEILGVFFPEKTVQLYRQAKTIVSMSSFTDIDRFPDDLKPSMETFYTLLKNMMTPIYSVLNSQVSSIADMLYIYLLTGETQEVPSDWFGKVMTINMFDEILIMSLSSEMTNLDELTQQIHYEHKKTFGAKRVKITKTAVSTAYYMQLKRANADWRFIVEEYIRRNKVSMPHQKNSARYAEIWRRNEAKLKKRMQRTEKILEIIIRDKK